MSENPWARKVIRTFVSPVLGLRSDLSSKSQSISLATNFATVGCERPLATGRGATCQFSINGKGDSLPCARMLIHQSPIGVDSGDDDSICSWHVSSRNSFVERLYGCCWVLRLYAWIFIDCGRKASTGHSIIRLRPGSAQQAIRGIASARIDLDFITG